MSRNTIFLNSINGLKISSIEMQSDFVLLGAGKSAFFHTSLLRPQTDKVLILTQNHQTKTSAVKSMWGFDSPIPYKITDNAADLKQFIKESLANDKSVTFVLTTYPERGQYWLNLIKSDAEIIEMLANNTSKFRVVLPHSPNSYYKDYLELGIPVAAIDYYIGIGGVEHDEKTEVSEVKVGVKEKLYFNISKKTSLSKSENDEMLAVLSYLCANQEMFRIDDVKNLELLPMNAFLHLAGMIAHILPILIQKDFLPKEILNVNDANEFFEILNSSLQKKSNEEISLAIGKSMKGKGFYREMPEIAGNLLIKEMSDRTIEIRRELIKRDIMQTSILDELGIDHINTKAHAFNYLREKYFKQYKDIHGISANNVSFGEFIKTNPPYQNRGIMIPTKADGSIDGAHRFFREEIPTLLRLRDYCKTLGIDSSIFDKVISFSERLIEIAKVPLPHLILTPAAANVKLDENAIKLEKEMKPSKSKL